VRSSSRRGMDLKFEPPQFGRNLSSRKQGVIKDDILFMRLMQNFLPAGCEAWGLGSNTG